MSEAINSMFQWYTDAATCYVFLADVGQRGGLRCVEKNILRSRWFTRGWTLQELLAPSTISFYSRDWLFLGTKHDLLHVIADATRIERRFLVAGADELEQASISKKMSWASRRQTARIEDEAYCLLGLFGVHMPLLYGEGKHAFQRLQIEIMKSNPMDHTLFAWGTVIDKHDWSRSIPHQDDSLHLDAVITPSASSVWAKDKAEDQLYGLLAESPLDFEASGDFTPWFETILFYRRNCQSDAFPTVVGSAIRLGIPARGPPMGAQGYSYYHWDRPEIVQKRPAMSILLLCGLGSSEGAAIWIPIQGWGVASYGRTREFYIDHQAISNRDFLSSMVSTLYIEPERKFKVQSGDVIMKALVFPPAIKRMEVRYASTGVQYLGHERVVRAVPRPFLKGPLGVSDIIFRFPEAQRRGVAVRVTRLPPAEDAPWWSGAISVSLLPLHFDKNLVENIHFNDVVWYPEAKLWNLTEPLMGKTMETPRDIWEVDVPFMQLMHVEVERMPLGDEGGSLDVLSVKIFNAQRLAVGSPESLSSFTSVEESPAPATRRSPKPKAIKPNGTRVTKRKARTVAIANRRSKRSLGK